MARFYPAPEGTTNPDGQEYPILPFGEIRPEMNRFLSDMRFVCHTKSYLLIVESLNHGRHAPNSMHYRGLAADVNMMNAQKEWLSFDEQTDIIVGIGNQIGYDVWIWPDDLNTHTHFSIHPKEVT